MVTLLDILVRWDRADPPQTFDEESDRDWRTWAVERSYFPADLNRWSDRGQIYVTKRSRR